MSAGRILCLVAWILAAIVQLIVVSGMPDRLVISGIDLSDANRTALLHGAFFIGCGLMLASGAFIPRRWTWLLALLSAVLYLVHWFPFQSVKTYGLVTVFKGMFLIGWNPGLRLSFVTRDIVLPIAFVTSIALLLFGRRRGNSALHV